MDGGFDPKLDCSLCDLVELSLSLNVKYIVMLKKKGKLHSSP